MTDDRIERLLRGYGLPETRRDFDRRVLAQADRILAPTRTREAIAAIGSGVANALGFGYVNYVIDLVTASDADYRVDVI